MTTVIPSANTASRKPAMSRWLGVVVAVWLNLAVQPCAMALGADEGCPHCPPSHGDEMAAHHGHHETDIREGCDSPLSDCADSEEFSLDARHSQAKQKDNSGAVIIVAPTVSDAIPHPDLYATTAADPPLLVATSPPLHLLNCVFLD